MYFLFSNFLAPYSSVAMSLNFLNACFLGSRGYHKRIC